MPQQVQFVGIPGGPLLWDFTGGGETTGVLAPGSDVNGTILLPTRGIYLVEVSASMAAVSSNALEIYKRSSSSPPVDTVFFRAVVSNAIGLGTPIQSQRLILQADEDGGVTVRIRLSNNSVGMVAGDVCVCNISRKYLGSYI